MRRIVSEVTPVPAVWKDTFTENGRMDHRQQTGRARVRHVFAANRRRTDFFIALAIRCCVGVECAVVCDGSEFGAWKFIWSRVFKGDYFNFADKVRCSVVQYFIDVRTGRQCANRVLLATNKKVCGSVAQVYICVEINLSRSLKASKCILPSQNWWNVYVFKFCVLKCAVNRSRSDTRFVCVGVCDLRKLDRVMCFFPSDALARMNWPSFESEFAATSKIVIFPGLGYRSGWIIHSASVLKMFFILPIILALFVDNAILAYWAKLASLSAINV